MQSLKAPSLSSLISERESTSLRGSNDSLIDSLELDDDIDDTLYSIPPEDQLPSLEAVMSEIDSDMDNFSVDKSIQINYNNTPTPSVDAKHTGSILRHCIFQGVTTQIASAAERISAGFATAIAVSKLISVGTSRGYILTFDNMQVLRWCCLEGQQKEQGSVSAISFNEDDSRLLAGFARGYIIMINTDNGNILRCLSDSITPNSGVLNVRWTCRPTLALALDTGGSVWSLSFTRRLGVRGCESRCLFSGARGEVCALEPLVLNDEQHPLKMYSLVALATLSKFFIIMVRPRLKVIKYHMLVGPSDSLPLLSWQMVLIQHSDASRTVDPVLASGRGNHLYFHQLTSINGRIMVLFLRHITLSYNLVALHWLGPKTIACIDTSEVLHLLDVRTNKEQENIDISNFGIVYSSAQFKGLATGGNVSPALARAGTFSSYNTIVASNTQLYVLGKKSLHCVNVRSWSDRLSFLTARQNWTEAFELAVDGFRACAEKPRRHGITKERILLLFDDYLKATARCPELCLEPVMKCLIEIDQIDLMWQELWERLMSHEFYLNLVTQHIENDKLRFISPTVSQALVEFWVARSTEKLEAIILKLDWQCLDLHQVLTVSRKEKLYKAQMHLNTKALGDYTISIVDLLLLINDEDQEEGRVLGNNLLVYISSCLAGRGYPSGEIHKDLKQSVRHDILRVLTVAHSNNATDNEPTHPYLRSLLRFDTRETLNVLALAFQEQEFNSDLGLSQRQRIINILLEIMTTQDEDWSQQFGILCNFISQQMASKSLPDSSSLLEKIVEYLQDTKSVRNGEYTNYRQHAEKEQTFLNLLESNALTNMFTYQDLLEIARSTRCFQVAQYILEKLKMFDEILVCYILDKNRHLELFSYIMEHKNDDTRKIYQQILSHFEQLLTIDSEKITKIITEFYPICVPQFLKLIQHDPKLSFVFLRNLIQGGLDLEPKDYDNYLNLLCQFNSESVLEFLETNNSYDVDQALVVVEQYNLTTSLILLYEKKLDYQRAFGLAIDLLKEAPESQAENHALQASALCFRASNVLCEAEREVFWFSLIENILSRTDLRSIVKNVLHSSSSFVDLSRLVQMIMDISGNNGTSKNNSFGDIKHILIGMLTNFEYESLLLNTTGNVLSRDLHKIFMKEKKVASHGVIVRSLKCVLCNMKLFRPSSVTQDAGDEEQVIVFSICGHAMHNKCFQIDSQTTSQSIHDLNSMHCKKCAVVILEKDSVYLGNTIFSEENSIEDSSELLLKAPVRKGIENK